MDLEKCIKGYEDGNQNATITNDTFCAGFLDKDACGVSTDQLKLSIDILYMFIYLNTVKSQVLTRVV